MQSTLRLYTVLLTFLSISAGAPHNSEFLEQVSTVEALLRAGKVAEAQNAVRNLQYGAESAVKIGVFADLFGVALLDQQRYSEAAEASTIVNRSRPFDPQKRISSAWQPIWSRYGIAPTPTLV
jgi:hypothetical protein